MGQGQESFVFYRSFWEATKDLPSEVFKELFCAVSKYSFDSTEPEGLSPIAMMAFTLIKPQLDANMKRREDGQKGTEYGKRGGRPKKAKEQVEEQTEEQAEGQSGKPEEPTENREETQNPYGDNKKNPMGLTQKPLRGYHKNPLGVNTETPNVNVNVNVNDNVNVNRKNIKKENETPPDGVVSLTPSQNKDFFDWLKENCPNVCQMKQPLTDDQLQGLLRRYPPEAIKSIFIKMQNWKPLNQKNVSAYLTFLNWVETEFNKDKLTKNEKDKSSKCLRAPEETGGEPTFTPVPD